MSKRIKPRPVDGAPVLLDPEQACALIGCDRRTLDKLERQDEIICFRLGSLKRYPASQFDPPPKDAA